MSAERLLYVIGDIRGDLIREAAPAGLPRRRRWPWAAALAACLCLVLLMARTTAPAESGDPGDSRDSPSGGEDSPVGCAPFPGEISQPLLYWQGTAYVWDSSVEELPATGQWTQLGPLAGVTAEETSEDLWLYADIGQVSGTVYADPKEHPGVLYVLMTTEWFEEGWVRFVADKRLLTPAFFYGGQLYYLDPRQYPAHNAVMTLPAGYKPVGTLVPASDPDRLPDRELEVNWEFGYGGHTLYAKPGYDGTLYVECQRVWSGGSYPLYAPATLRPQPQP